MDCMWSCSDRVFVLPSLPNHVPGEKHEPDSISVLPPPAIDPDTLVSSLLRTRSTSSRSSLL